MESKTKFLGHPVHPMLIVFPLGLLVTSVIFDIVYLITQDTLFSVIAFYNIIAGIIGGLLAAIFGFIDWLAIPPDTRAKSVGLLHGLANVVVVVLFGASWLVRMGEPDNLPTTFALVLSFLGFAVGGFSAWLGGELVDRLGVGVDPGAHLDAPNSLSDEPASTGRGAQGIPKPLQ
jgi:uncharacterized membrane protein